jgi:hypothetical protein
MQILVGRWAQGLEAKIVNDQKRHASERGELALVATGGPGGIQTGGELRAAGEDDIDALADGAMAEGLGEMALADTDLAYDEDRGVLGDIAAGGQIMDQGAIELRQPIEVELIEGLAGAEARAAQPQGELLLLTRATSSWMRRERNSV